MKYLIAYAIILTIVVISLLFHTKEIESNYERLKIKTSDELSRLQMDIDTKEKEKSILDAQIIELQEKSTLIETKKDENNEKTAIDVAFIYNVSLDTLVRKEYTRPEGY